GYSVLVPNPFYRISKAPQFTTAANLDFKDQDVMAKIRTLMSSVQSAGAAEKDAVAFVAFLDAQRQVDKTKKIGTQGYCMGGSRGTSWSRCTRRSGKCRCCAQRSVSASPCRGRSGGTTVRAADPTHPTNRSRVSVQWRACLRRPAMGARV